MRLERMEEICLEFLRQTLNPLTPVKTLYEKCVEQSGGNPMPSYEVLERFLREHRDLMVIDGPGVDSPVSPESLRQVGVEPGAHAILKSRMPSRDEMKDMLRMQLEEMRTHLLDALKGAREHHDQDAMEKIEDALARNESIRERIEEL